MRNWVSLYSQLHEQVGDVTNEDVEQVVSRDPCRGVEILGLFILAKLPAARILADRRLFDAMSPSQAAFMLLDDKLSVDEQRTILNKWASEDPVSAGAWAELSHFIEGGENHQMPGLPEHPSPSSRSRSLESIRSISELLRSLGRDPADATAYASLHWANPYSNLLSKAASGARRGKDLATMAGDRTSSDELLDLLGVVAADPTLSYDDYDRVIMIQHGLLEDQRKKAGLQHVAEIEHANADWRGNQERLGVLHAVPEILSQTSVEEGEQFLRLIETRGSLAAVDDYMARNPDSLTRLKLVKIEPGDIPYLK